LKGKTVFPEALLRHIKGQGKVLILLILRGGWVDDNLAAKGTFLEEKGALLTGTKIHLFEF